MRLVALLLLFAGCANAQPVTFDRTQEPLTITVTVLKIKDIQKLFLEYWPNRKLSNEVSAFSRYPVEGDWCDIYVTNTMRPLGSKDLSHEMRHCLYGQWHRGASGRYSYETKR